MVAQCQTSSWTIIEELWRDGSCHFSPLQGPIVKSKTGPWGPKESKAKEKRNEIRMTVWLVHTRFNRRPIVLPSFFCKMFHSQKNIVVTHYWGERLHLCKKFLAPVCLFASVFTNLAASVDVQQTNSTSQLLGVLDAGPQNTGGEIQGALVWLHTQNTNRIYLLLQGDMQSSLLYATWHRTSLIIWKIFMCSV